MRRGSLGGEQRHCSSALIEFDSTTGEGKKNVLLLSFKPERGPFSPTAPSPHPAALTKQPLLPLLLPLAPASFHPAVEQTPALPGVPAPLRSHHISLSSTLEGQPRSCPWRCCDHVTRCLLVPFNLVRANSINKRQRQCGKPH